MFRFVTLTFFLIGAACAAAPAGAQSPRPQYGPYYSGQLLVAKPSMKDPRFAETVIYLAEHDGKGAFGLTVNRRIGQGPLKDFMMGMEMAPSDEVNGEINLYAGGPVEPGAGFVLHTNDYQSPTTAMFRGRVAVTASLRAIKDIAHGRGPRKHLVILGYSGWGAGQLEGELQRGDWDIAPFDEDLVFGDDDKTKWSRARQTVGIPM